MQTNRVALFLLSSISFIVFLTSCTRINYNYGNQSFETPESALEAQKKDIDSTLTKITETKTPIGGSAIVIIPSIEYVKNHFISLKGQELTEEFKAKSYNYVSKINVNQFKAQGEAIEKRKIFNRVVVLESNDPSNASFEDDIAIILFNKDGKAKWFMKRKRDNPINLIEIEEITTALPPLQRTTLWLDKIEKAANGE